MQTLMQEKTSVKLSVHLLSMASEHTRNTIACMQIHRCPCHLLFGREEQLGCRSRSYSLVKTNCEIKLFLHNTYFQHKCHYVQSEHGNTLIRPVVLKFYKNTEPSRSFPSFFQTAFFPRITESKNGLKVSDDLRRTPGTAPSNPRGSIEPSLRTTGLDESNKSPCPQTFLAQTGI